MCCISYTTVAQFLDIFEVFLKPRVKTASEQRNPDVIDSSQGYPPKKKTRKQQFSCRKNRIQHDTTGFPNTFLMERDQHILWISSHLIIWNHVIGVCCGPLLKSQFLTSSESENARVEGVQASSALQFSLLSLSSKLPSLKLYCNSTWKWMVGRLLSSWDGLLSGAMLVSGGVWSYFWIY